jgi:hypothetical protein
MIEALLSLNAKNNFPASHFGGTQKPFPKRKLHALTNDR